MAYYLTDNSEDLLEYLITKGLDINHLNKDVGSALIGLSEKHLHCNIHN